LTPRLNPRSPGSSDDTPCRIARPRRRSGQD
jgi:hypothetical protein